MSELIEIARYSSEFAAQLALARLRNIGITARMLTDDAGGTLPSLDMLSKGVRVVVRAEDEVRARETLEEGEGHTNN